MRESRLSLNICTIYNVVIDHGTQQRPGSRRRTPPSSINIPTQSSDIGRHKGAKSLGLETHTLGPRHRSSRGILAISNPIKQGVVQDWDDLESIWDHIWSRELQAAPSDLPVPSTHPSSTGEWNKMAEILIEKMEVPAIFLANKSVMALYGGGQMTGISVDSGHDTTYIVSRLPGQPHTGSNPPS